MSKTDHLDYDYLIIGSGFGGSVSALDTRKPSVDELEVLGLSLAARA